MWLFHEDAYRDLQSPLRITTWEEICTYWMNHGYMCVVQLAKVGFFHKDPYDDIFISLVPDSRYRPTRNFFFEDRHDFETRIPYSHVIYHRGTSVFMLKLRAQQTDKYGLIHTLNKF